MTYDVSKWWLVFLLSQDSTRPTSSITRIVLATLISPLSWIEFRRPYGYHGPRSNFIALRSYTPSSSLRQYRQYCGLYHTNPLTMHEYEPFARADALRVGGSET